MIRILFIRHGEVENTSDGSFRYNGHIDVDLSENGVLQMEKLGKFLKENKDVVGNISKIYCSDLKRSRKSAEIVANHTGSPIFQHRELRELAQGIWEGLTLEEVFEKYPDMVKERFRDFVNYRVPGGESIIDGERRATPLLNSIIQENQGKTVAIVAHSGINSIMITKLLGMPFELIMKMRSNYGSLSIVDVYETDVILRLFNASTYTKTIPL